MTSYLWANWSEFPDLSYFMGIFDIVIVMGYRLLQVAMHDNHAMKC